MDRSEDAFALVRYDAAGHLDTRFGDNGLAKSPIGTARALGRQADGKFVAAGAVPDPARPEWASQFAVVRYFGGVCGDGVVDSGEECDDGNDVPCDGCSTRCRVEATAVCGDAIIRPECGEQCDDGNTTSGDGCSATCQMELIAGGGSASADCWTEWGVLNPHNRPLLDRHKRLTRRQTCRDNDPTCDFDGGVNGSCTFAITLCANVADARLLSCGVAALSSWKVITPSAKAALGSPAIAAIRDQLVPGGEALLAQAAGTCTAPMRLTVRLRNTAKGLRAASQVLKTVAAVSARRGDTDMLKFVCTP